MTLQASTILVVEDEFLIRMMLVETLIDDGFLVQEAGDAAEALAALGQSAAIDLVLTDVTLPGPLDGLGLAQEVRRLRPGVPIIFVTGRPDVITPDMLQARDALIAKPYLPSEIAAAARRILQP